MATKDTEVMNGAGGEIVLYQPDERIKLYSQDAIQNRIFTIRGEQVIMDADLEEFNNVKTIVLNQAVKRNEGRFPNDIGFNLLRKKRTNLSHFVIGSGI